MQTTQYLTIKGVWKMGLKKGCILMTAALAVLLFVGQADANTAASADFDGNGEVGVPDFLLFIATFGSRQGDENMKRGMIPRFFDLSRFLWPKSALTA